MSIQILETERLRMVPFTLVLMKTSLAGRDSFEEMLGVKVAQSWPGSDLAEALPIFIAEQEKDPSGAIWNGLIVQKAEQILIGDIGLMNGPDEQGNVEIGYSIVPEYRNHGYASEMASALVQWALQQPSIQCITAKILKENAPSIKVISRAGLQSVGEEDEWLLWELRKN